MAVAVAGASDAYASDANSAAAVLAVTLSDAAIASDAVVDAVSVADASTL